MNVPVLRVIKVRLKIRIPKKNPQNSLPKVARKISMIEKVQAIRYTPSKYQQSEQREICQEFLKGECRKADKCEFSHEEDGSLHKIKIESGDDVKNFKKENGELREYIERMRAYILDEANTEHYS